MASKEKKISLSKQIEALSRISTAITSESYLEDILKLIVTVTAEVMKSKICSLMLLNEKNELVIRATQSVSEEYNKKPHLKIGEGIAGKVVKEKKSVSIYDVTKESEYKNRNVARKEGLSSLLCVPLIVKSKAIGVLNSYTSKPHKYTKNEVNILISVANQAAIVIENFRLVVQSKVITEELETRKAVEKAKGILMKDEGLSEDEAFRKIQKFSMNNRRPMREVAEAIILAQNLKNK